MIEFAAVIGVTLVLAVVAAGGGFAHADLLLLAGAGVLALGLVAGVGAGVVYHLALYRELSPRGTLGSGWWWRPTSFHPQLTLPMRRRVMPWFSVGAAGFFVALAGCAIVLAAILAL